MNNLFKYINNLFKHYLYLHYKNILCSDLASMNTDQSQIHLYSHIMLFLCFKHSSHMMFAS